MRQYKEYYEFTKIFAINTKRSNAAQNSVHEDLKFHRVDSLGTSTLPSLFHQISCSVAQLVKVSHYEREAWVRNPLTST